MTALLLCLWLTVAAGRTVVENEGDLKLWNELRDVLPPAYARYAEENGLSSDKNFQESIVRKLHNQVVSDSQVLQARQKILHEYVSCSCDKCPDFDKEEGVPSRQGRRIFNPLAALREALVSEDKELALKTIGLLRFSGRQQQIQSQQLTALVSCNCPGADRCRRILDPLVFSIVGGHNETELQKAYWQKSLEEFPPLLGKGVMDRLQSALSSVLGYFDWRQQPPLPQKDTKISINQTQPPNGIFAPGENKEDWVNPNKPQGGICSVVQVNIDNSRKGQKVVKTMSTTTETPTTAETN